MIRLFVAEDQVGYQDVNGFVQLLFELNKMEYVPSNCSARGGDKLTWEQLRRVIIEQGLWQSHFGLSLDQPFVGSPEWTEVGFFDTLELTTSGSGSGSGKFRSLLSSGSDGGRSLSPAGASATRPLSPNSPPPKSNKS